MAMSLDLDSPTVGGWDARVAGGLPTRSQGTTAGGGTSGRGPKPPCPAGQIAMWIPDEDPYVDRGSYQCIDPGRSPGPGSTGGGGGRDTAATFSYETPAFSGPYRPEYNIPGAPTFAAPEFTAPSPEELLNDPGYQFREAQGRGTLEASAAARGVTRTGMNLQNILKFGQQFASNEYANAFNRALETWDRQFQARRAEFDPRFAEWQTIAAAQQRAAEIEAQRRWDDYIFGVNDKWRREALALELGAG